LTLRVDDGISAQPSAPSDGPNSAAFLLFSLGNKITSIAWQRLECLHLITYLQLRKYYLHVVRVQSPFASHFRFFIAGLV
jgi:hypothetical protein